MTTKHTLGAHCIALAIAVLLPATAQAQASAAAQAPAGAAADGIAGSAAELDAALARAFASVTERLSRAGAIAGFQDPAMRADLAVIERVTMLVGSPTLPADDLNAFTARCAPPAILLRSFVTDGVSGLAPDRVGPAVEGNMVRFQSDVAMLVDVGARCSAAYMPALADFWAALPVDDRTPVRRAGIQQMRGGFIQTLAGSAALVVDQRVSRANRTRLATMLSVVIGDIARQMPLTQRAELRAGLAPLVARFPAEHADSGARLLAALASRECVELCMVE